MQIWMIKERSEVPKAPQVYMDKQGSDPIFLKQLFHKVS